MNFCNYHKMPKQYDSFEREWLCYKCETENQSAGLMSKISFQIKRKAVRLKKTMMTYGYRKQNKHQMKGYK